MSELEGRGYHDWKDKFQKGVTRNKMLRVFFFLFISAQLMHYCISTDVMYCICLPCSVTLKCLNIKVK